jgi:DNA-binding transcriptional LysR family regulator
LHTLGREHLLALADFKKACAGQVVQLTVAAGDSLIQWLLLPRLKAIRERLPDTAFRILNLPTAETAARLRDGTVDIALVRAESTNPPLKTSPLGAMTFSLFVPRRMRPAAGPEELSTRALASLPLATLEGAGQFRQKLDHLARRRKCGLRIELELSSFPLVARAVQTGDFAALLPSIASAELADSDVVELSPDFLRPLSREIVLAWNPRLARIRAAVEKALSAFRDCCRVSV